MEANFIGSDGKTTKVNIPEQVFGTKYNEALVHQLIVAYMSNARSGTRAQKSRSQVQKSTHKLWKQKGTGRARSGTGSNPIRRGGGRIFPNLPIENFTQKINKKMYRKGISVILSQLYSEDKLCIFDKFLLSNPKTKEFLVMLDSINLDNDLLIITEDIDDNLYFSTRNIPTVTITDTLHTDPVILLKHKKVLISLQAVNKFEELLA
ncbi:MAG: 50S ribosomal protein L4 [Nitrosomonas sp.]|nr:50S ribosomal protein L4 [Nitrosomonas sp.]MBK7364198.1 50S ribosomal protein L4 [Nitrosomonas sp.]